MSSTPPTMLCGLIGHPLGHSLSPILHNWGFAHCGLAGVYMAWDTPPERLREVITAVRALHIVGISVTIPHKEAVLMLADRQTPLAQAAGAANTLFWENGLLVADNTDIEGFMHPLRAYGHIRTALVLGTGGVARAALFGLKELGLQNIMLCGRNPDKTALLAKEFSVQNLEWEKRGSWLAEQGVDIVINTTPLGMKGAFEGKSALELEHFEHAAYKGLAYDLVYTPTRTRFLANAATAGWQIQEGLAMLAAQGIAQFLRWTGRELPFNDVLTLLRRQLA